MKYLIVSLLSIGLLVSHQAVAQEQDASAEISAPALDPTFEERVKLAKKMHELRPVRAQVEQAINQYAQVRPQAERETFKTAMRNVFNVKALEKISVDAYADTFTVEELRAMVEYYSKPEAISASNKFSDYANIVYPEIVRMLDRAAIRVKTGQ
ncbi:MAG: hypothetical protein AB8B83_01670 [Bdellovibrionales bacterium]